MIKIKEDYKRIGYMKISIDEQAQLRARAKKELDRLEEVMSDKQIMQLLDKYKEALSTSPLKMATVLF